MSEEAEERAGTDPMDVPEPGWAPPAVVFHEQHILDRIGVLYRYRGLLLVIVTLVVAGAALQTYTTVPMYRAQTRLVIEEERSPLADFKLEYSAYRDPEPYYQTQYRILQSRGLAQKAVRMLELRNVPEFNGHGPQPTSVSLALARARSFVTGLAPWRRGGGETDPAAGDTPSESSLISTFLSRVEVTPVRNSRLVDLGFQSADPEFAARAVNTLAEAYVAQNLELKVQTTDRTVEWLSEELAKQQRTVERSERALAEYREQEDALSLEDRQNIVVARLNQLNDAVTRAKTVRIQKETLHRQLESLDGGAEAIESMPAVLQNPFIQTLKARLAELQQERLRLADRYGDRHPEIVKLDVTVRDTIRQLTGEVAKVAGSVRNDYQAALSEERTLTSALEAQKQTAMALDRKSISYTVLERQAQSDRQVYEALLQREKELRVASNSRTNNVRLLDRAEVPGGPFAPNPRRTLFLGLLLGLALSVGVVLCLDYLDDTVKTPEDVARKLKVPFLGMVPAIRNQRIPVLLGNAPNDFGEAYRALRTSLVFTNPSGSPKVVLVTSAQPLEGKTTTTCNLAIALALSGARVLLIDADMRRPGLHRTLGLRNAVGLSHVLVDQAQPSAAIQELQDPNLWVMTAGRTPPNPSELLGSNRMKGLLEHLSKGMFDWVIIDTPPVLAVTDAVIMSSMVSGVAFVIGSEMTRRRLAERALEMLGAAKPRILGAVLNRVDVNRNKYYYSRYYGYSHRSYYGETPARAA